MLYKNMFNSILLAILFGVNSVCLAHQDIVQKSLPPLLHCLTGEQTISQYVLNINNNAVSNQLGLTDAVRLALENSPELRKADSVILQRGISIDIKKTSYWPSIIAEVGYSQSERSVQYSGIPDQDYAVNSQSNKLVVGVNWMLFDSGRRSAELENAIHLVNSANFERDAVVRKLIISVVEMYHKVHGASAIARAYLESERLAWDSAGVVDGLFKAGAVSMSDSLLASTNAQQMSLLKLQAENDMHNALADFAKLTGLHRNATIETSIRHHFDDEIMLNASVDDLIEIAFRNNPLLRSLEQQLISSAARIKAVDAENHPILSFSGSISRSQIPQNEMAISEKSSGWLIGVVLKVPLFDGFANTYKRKAAIAEREEIHVDVETTKQDIRYQVYNIRNAPDIETQRIKLINAQLINAQSTFNVVQGRYASGVGSVIELIKGQNDLAESRQQKIKSLADWQSAKLRLAILLGDLNAILCS